MSISLKGKKRFICIFSAWMLILSMIVSYNPAYAFSLQSQSVMVENEAKEVQTVHQVVIFIRFANQGPDIYESRGGYDYIKSLYEGKEKSLWSYLNEFSWGQVDVKTHYLPMDDNGTPLCYQDPYPSSYYLLQSNKNPDGYTSANKGTRRSTLLKNALKFVGEDFEKKLGIEGELYNLVFMVPDRGNWNDLLWSHKSGITINGRSQTYNMITYPSKSDISKTIAHEFLHSLGFKDLYHSNSSSGPEPVGKWSIMASTSGNAGHPLVHDKDRYGKWLEGTSAIKTVRRSGHYELGPATADPTKNVIALKIPVEGNEKQFFMVEYRGSSGSGTDLDLKQEGLIFYRVNLAKSGNFSGPPDEMFVLRPGGKGVYYGCYDGTEGKTEMTDFTLYNETHNLGIKVTNIKKEDGFMSFDISMPYECMDGTSVTDLKATGSSPQKVGTEISFIATVEKEAITEKSVYEYMVEKDGKIQKLSMVDDFTANWTPTEAGVYTITYTVTDAEGVISAKKLNYVIGTDTTSFVLYNNTSWQQPYIHYRVGTGAWTTVPGEKMIACDIKGYKWIYPIELGKAGTKGTLCFNNGNNTWDSKNEQNYTVEVGVYGIKNSTCTKLEETTVITPVVTLVPKQTVAPTVAPTVTPSAIATIVPTVTPTVKPTATPTAKPTATPTVKPTATPTPTAKPTATPTAKPTATPVVTATPTIKPTATPVVTATPTVVPTAIPTKKPEVTITPTVKPTNTPTATPTTTPEITTAPTYAPVQTEFPKVGETVLDQKTGATYKIVSKGGKLSAQYTGTDKKLNKIIIPEQVNIAGEVITISAITAGAFKNNKTVKTVVIGKHVTSIGQGAFQNCTSLQTVKNGENVQSIGKNAFYGCKKLKSISIGKKVKKIGVQAFYKCTSLTKITIPSKVESIGKNAFYGCKKLSKITIKTQKLTAKNTGAKAFTGIASKVVIEVPAKKLKDYKKLLKNKGIGKKAKIKKATTKKS